MTVLRCMTMIAVPALLAGCVLSAEGEIPEVEVVQENVAFPGAPRAGEESLTIPVTQSVPRFQISSDNFDQVTVQEVSIAARSGVTDLSFIRTLRISVNTAQGHARGEPGIGIAQYERAAGAPPVGPTLVIPSAPPADVVRVWQARTVVVVTEFVGDLPAQAWSADLGVRYAARLSLD